MYGNAMGAWGQPYLPNEGRSSPCPQQVPDDVIRAVFGKATAGERDKLLSLYFVARPRVPADDYHTDVAGAKIAIVNDGTYANRIGITAAGGNNCTSSYIDISPWVKKGEVAAATAVAGPEAGAVVAAFAGFGATNQGEVNLFSYLKTLLTKYQPTAAEIATAQTVHYDPEPGNVPGTPGTPRPKATAPPTAAGDAMPYVLAGAGVLAALWLLGGKRRKR